MNWSEVKSERGLVEGFSEALNKLGLSMDREILGCIQDAQEILAFDLPKHESESFLKFHDFITNPQPRFITEWRSTTEGNKWYLALVEGLNGTTRNAYMNVLYHFQKLAELESQVIEKISKRNYQQALGNSVVAIGNTHIWDFEYQAFVLAYRRCLDYLTRGLAAFFKHDSHSFNDFPDLLARLQSKNNAVSAVAGVLIEVHKKHAPNFTFVMSEGNRKSVRDRITHYEWVGAGTINLTETGLALVGGGEALSPAGNTVATNVTKTGFVLAGGSEVSSSSGQANSVRLTEVLALRIRTLKACIDEMLTAFVTEAKIWDAGQTKIPTSHEGKTS